MTKVNENIINGNTNQRDSEPGEAFHRLRIYGKNKQDHAEQDVKYRNDKVDFHWPFQVGACEAPVDQTGHRTCIPNPVGEHTVAH